MNPDHSNEDAFSLLEVVIALAIFAFCIVGIVGLLPVAMDATRTVSQETNVNNIAESIAGLWTVSTNAGINITNSSLPVTNLFIGVSNSPAIYFDDFGRETDSNGASLRLEYSAQTNATYTNSFDVNLVFYWPPNAATNSPTVNKRAFTYLFTK
jgi:uncharacterized protein (TIGR02598 family)